MGRDTIFIFYSIFRDLFSVVFSASLFLWYCTWVLAQKPLVKFGGLRPFSSRFFISFLHLTNSKIILTFYFSLQYFLYRSAMRVNSMNRLSLVWQCEELLKFIVFVLRRILCSCFNIKFIL